MLSCNLWTERRLVNGSMGTVASILYRSGGPLDLPVAVMVQFDKYSGPTWGGDRCVPIAPVTRTWRSGQRKLSRQQLPLRLAWAVTVHKSQGLTLDMAVIDIGEKNFSTVLSFVALSYVRKLQDCLIKQFTFDRLKNLSRNKNVGLRKNKEKRLAALGLKGSIVQATGTSVMQTSAAETCGVAQSLSNACRPLSQPLPITTQSVLQTATVRPARAPRGRSSLFGSYVDGDYDEHLDGMRKQGTWGTDAEIMGAATLFGISIRVFYRGGDEWEWHTHEPLFAFQLPCAVDRIELVNYDRQRYDLVVSLPGSVSLLEGLQVPEDCVPYLPL